MRSSLRYAALGGCAALGVALAFVTGSPAQGIKDKYTVSVPGGLSFFEFKGYETWQTISISRNERVMAVILGNPAMISAYEAGFPGNGKPIPDYDPANDTFVPGTAASTPPQGNDAKCGFACHTLAKANDYVFTEFPKR